jgi:hypothetical protein
MFGHKKDHGLAGFRLSWIRLPPVFSPRDAAVRVSIKKDVVPPFGREPVNKRNRFVNVLSRTADKDARLLSHRRWSTVASLRPAPAPAPPTSRYRIIIRVLG